MSSPGEIEPIKQSVWLANTGLTFLSNNQASVRIKKVVHLANNLVFKIMARTFEAVSRDAYYITVIARVILSDRVSGKIYQEDEVFRAENVIAAQFERINDWVDRRIEQATQKLRLAGVDPEEVQAMTTPYEAVSTTRTATDYLTLLKKADIYLSLHEYLWIAAELSDNQQEALKAKLNNELDLRQHLMSISRRTTAQFLIIHRICRAVQNDRKVASAEESARAKQRAAEEGPPPPPARKKQDKPLVAQPLLPPAKAAEAVPGAEAPARKKKKQRSKKKPKPADPIMAGTAVPRVPPEAIEQPPAV